MKANEIQIGDYVNYRGQIIKVTSLYDKGGSNEVGWSDKESVWVNGRCIEPIPLTPEILEKNGWMYIAEDKVFYPENLKGELPWICYITDGSNEVFRMKDFCNLQYVHELQHALRLCEIEKAIEL